MQNNFDDTNSGIFAEQDRLEEEKRKIKEAEKKFEADLKCVMGLPQGRRILSWILSIPPMDTSISVKDPYAMCVLSGRRDVGLTIINRLKEVCPDAVELMFREQRNG